MAQCLHCGKAIEYFRAGWESMKGMGRNKQTQQGCSFQQKIICPHCKSENLRDWKAMGLSIGLVFFVLAFFRHNFWGMLIGFSVMILFDRILWDNVPQFVKPEDKK